MYAEIGIGNSHLVSTEIEDGCCEYRVKGWHTGRIRSVYARLWVRHTVIIIDTVDGIKIQRKGRKAFKAIVGVVSTRAV